MLDATHSIQNRFAALLFRYRFRFFLDGGCVPRRFDDLGAQKYLALQDSKSIRGGLVLRLWTKGKKCRAKGLASGERGQK